MKASRTIRRAGAVLAAAALASTTACGSGGAGGGGDGSEFPSRGLTLIAAGHPGGGLDTASRQLKAGLEAAGVEQEVTVENIGGGGGNPARASLLKRKHDGYSVVVESDRVFLNPMLGTTDMTLSDFTPIANLTSDYEVWAVKSDSKYKSAKQVLKAVQKDPDSVSFGVGTVPSDDQFNILQAADHFGIDDLKGVNIVAFKSGGNLNTELLGGHVDVVSTGLSEAVQLAEAGKIRLLSISSAKPQGGAAKGVPTWNQIGLDFSVSHWRGVFGPADMPDAAVKWWVDTIRKASKTDEWQQQVKKVDLAPDFVPRKKFLNKVIKPQKKVDKQIIEELGLGK